MNTSRTGTMSMLACAISFCFGPVIADDGISGRYPRDAGMENDPNVVFVERFDEGSISAVVKRWESVENPDILSLSSDIPTASGDGSSLLMTYVGGQGTGAYLYRRLQPGFEKLHVRFYVKFDRACAPIHHFFHVGGHHPATSWPQGGAGERPRGDERFSTGIEPHGDAWVWDYYTYWMEMRGSPPRGQTWGNSFIHDPALKVARDEWICLEVMMKMNDQGDSNGEMALWIDGRQVSRLGKGYPAGKWVYDKFLPGEGGEGVRWNNERKKPDYLRFPKGGDPFAGFRWRSDERLQLNFLWVLLYITQAPRGQVSKVWFDNIVVAKEYIGPIQP